MVVLNFLQFTYTLILLFLFGKITIGYIHVALSTRYMNPTLCSLPIFSFTSLAQLGFIMYLCCLTGVTPSFKLILRQWNLGFIPSISVQDQENTSLYSFSIFKSCSLVVTFTFFSSPFFSNLIGASWSCLTWLACAPSYLLISLSSCSSTHTFRCLNSFCY